VKKGECIVVQHSLPAEAIIRGLYCPASHDVGFLLLSSVIRKCLGNFRSGHQWLCHAITQPSWL